MTHITMRVAMWEHGLALVPADEDAYLFAGIRFEILYVDNCMVFVQTDQGTALHLKRCTHSYPCLMYEFVYKESWGLPRFTLHTVELSLDEDGSMTWHMPDPHDLPWTNAQGLSADQRTMIAKRELALRVRSAAGNHMLLCHVAANVPRWARQALNYNVWNSLFGKA